LTKKTSRSRAVAFNAAAAALGALAVIGFAPERLYFLPPLTLGALYLLWEQTDAKRGAFLLGFAYGAGLFGFGVWWIYVALHEHAYLPAFAATLATAAFCAILAMYPAAALLLSRVLAPGRRFWRAMSFAAVWSFCEWLRGWLFTGFPWLALGYSQAPPHSPLSGWLPLFGVYYLGLSAALIGVCAALFVPERFLAALKIISNRRENGAHPRQEAAEFMISRKEKAAAAALVAFLILGGALLEEAEWTKAADAPPLAVSLLQGDISQSVKLGPEGARASLEVYQKMAKEARGDLIILPETALPFYVDELNRAAPQYLSELAGDNKTALVGAFARDDAGRKYNAAIAVFKDAQSHYYKRHLVPYGEYVPFESLLAPLIAAFRIPYSDLSAGEPSQILQTPAANLGVMICYEDAFGEEAILSLPQAQLLVNITNDAWYGESRMLEQHLQMSQTRAREAGRYLARAANDGISAMINHKGEITNLAPVGEREIVEASAILREGKTFYVLWGNAPVAAFLLSAVAALIFHRRRRDKNGG
jgi:apolipoprotein N-acyltransferase